MAKHAQIQELRHGETFRVVEETAGEVYFYDEFRRWCYFNKSEEGVNYRYIPAGTRKPKERDEVMPCGRRHNKYIYCHECYEKERNENV